MEKRAQFFLLAAVIISTVIISLGVGTNRVSSNNGPDNFYDFSYEVDREVGAVLDYDVYTDFDSDADLGEFVDLLSEEIKERNPGSDFLFIYGEGDNMSVKNFVSDHVSVDGSQIDGLDNNDESRVCFRGSCRHIPSRSEHFHSGDTTFSVSADRVGSDNILVEMGGSKLSFPRSSHKHVIFVMQKKDRGDRYIVTG